ncbi:glycosyltransferase family 90 protein [Armillaria luteobubalina]|uniref:Glycosyltransferase family 90 protein n=1 Tax=Armillaria luteobubalina TaxID=153913 RepID=A0AA39TP76_9AGAR|nr:glycosyltransferase family 90 protein [Armillaria luteobubalina]
MAFKAFTGPATIEHVEPVYPSSGDLRGLGNLRYEGAGKKISEILPIHEFPENGLLEVNPEGPHPIYQLIEFSERKWKAKLQRTSKTLDEAVAEYKRRYGRAPPRGFDRWWEYVEKNNVQLPDEYDQIYRDLEPYWGVNPVDLTRIVSEWEGHKDSFTLGKEEEHRVGLVNYTIHDPSFVDHVRSGAQMFSELLEDVDEFLSPFRAVFHPHDNPEHVTDWELREKMLEYARTGTHIDIDRPVVPIKDYGWISGCAPTSPAWKDPIDFTFNVSWPSPPPDTPKTFVFNHRKAMDPCLHPHLLREHGQFLPWRKGPTPSRRMVPSFAYSQTLLHHDITIAHMVSWLGELPNEEAIPWEKKTDDRLHRRGSTTGIPLVQDMEWRFSHRIRMMDWVEKGMDGNVTILASPRSIEERAGKGETVQKARYGPAMLDMAFSGGPVQCDPDVCEELKKRYEFTSWRSQKEQGRYKYIFDVDGNAWSGRFKWLLSTHALIFKSTVYPEWFTDRLMPWVHYIPIQGDYSDLWDALVFFRGDLKGDNNHEDLARKIASAGRDWSQTFWRKEDMTAYNYRCISAARPLGLAKFRLNSVTRKPRANHGLYEHPWIREGIPDLGKRNDCCAKAFTGNSQGLGTFPEEMQSEDLVNVLRGRVKSSTLKEESSLRRQLVVFSFIIACGFWTSDLFKAFIRPTTVNYAKPSYYHSWGNLEVLRNSYYERAGRNVQHNVPMHEFLTNGLLEVNPELPHPIYQLIDFSERKWKAKLQRASKTLDEAVDEYERRYRRPPPRGFDKWWEYVEKNNVQLPDEYDQIYRDLEPYWSIRPVDLNKIVREWEDHEDTFTLGKEEGHRVGLAHYAIRDPATYGHVVSGVQMFSEMLEDVDEFLPPFRAIFHPHDNPEHVSDWELREKMLEYARTGTRIQDIDYPIVPIKDYGWIFGCAPTSPAWKDPIDFTFNVSWPSPPPDTPKTFVFNHRKAMDPCLHPRLLREHGQFLPFRQGPFPVRRMVPAFAYSQTLLHHDITIAHRASWLGEISDEEAVEKGMDGNVTILAPPRSIEERAGKGETVQKARYGPAMLDMAFSGGPVQCDPDVCEELKKRYEFTSWRSQKEQGRYKYIFDVDGNAWSGRFKWLLSTHALIFKSTVYPEWFTDRLMPWVHYIPIQGDYSDLWDALVFFRGDLKGDNNHEDLARKIASAGRDWSRTFWRKEDMTAYNFRVFLEYARIMNTDRAAMTYFHRKKEE